MKARREYTKAQTEDANASVEDRIVQRLEGFAEALENREQRPISDRFDCRRIVLTLKPKPYAPEMVRKAREALGASQAVFALFSRGVCENRAGVGARTVRSEKNRLPVHGRNPERPAPVPATAA